MPQEEMIRQKLNLPYPNIESKPINKFEKNGQIFKAFPILFPYGTADFVIFMLMIIFSFKIT